MRTIKAFVSGAALGAGVMYFLDSRNGARRRTMVADRMRRLSRQAGREIDAGLRDLNHQGQGLAHELSAMIQSRATGARQKHAAHGRSFKWSPGPRLAAAACGTALMANCLARRTPGAMLLGTLGFALFNRGLTRQEGGIDVLKTIEIGAPVERVFDFFSHPENYARISDAVTHVELLGEGRFAKTMLIAGIPIRFEERFVKFEQNKLLQTHSEPSSAIEYCKQMCFEAAGNDRTRLHLHFRYQPPGGAFGHAVAALMGIDPKTLLIDLLMRAKFFLETGREPHDAVAHSRAWHQAARQQPEQRWSGNGHSAALHGSGAPADDVHRPGMTQFEQRSAWPPSPTAMPQPVESGERFPPAV
jgi:uncharacterized membrane protein